MWDSHLLAACTVTFKNDRSEIYLGVANPLDHIIKIKRIVGEILHCSPNDVKMEQCDDIIASITFAKPTKDQLSKHLSKQTIH